MQKTILITGATGTVAGALLPHLKNSGASVRALVRNEAKGVALKSQGIEVVIGDLEKPKSLPAAFAGVNTAFILHPPGPRAPEQSSNATWAAKQAGVKHIVRLSAVGAAHDAPTINSRLHALSDHEVMASGISYTILKPHFFFQNLMMVAEGVRKEGTVYLPLGEGRMGAIDVRDVGEVAAKVLINHHHKNEIITLTGPRSINMHDFAAALTDVLGKPVKYVSVPLEAALAGMAQMGLDEWTQNLMGDYFTAYSRNWADFTTIEATHLLGRAPRSIKDFVTDYADAFR